MNLPLKQQLLLSVTLPASQNERRNMRTIAWRFAFGVMQPFSVNTNPALECDCPSPDLLLRDCPWHGIAATRECNTPYME